METQPSQTTCWPLFLCAGSNSSWTGSWAMATRPCEVSAARGPADNQLNPLPAWFIRTCTNLPQIRNARPRNKWNKSKYLFTRLYAFSQTFTHCTILLFSPRNTINNFFLTTHLGYNKENWNKKYNSWAPNVWCHYAHLAWWNTTVSTHHRDCAIYGLVFMIFGELNFWFFFHDKLWIKA